MLGDLIVCLLVLVRPAGLGRDGLNALIGENTMHAFRPCLLLAPILIVASCTSLAGDFESRAAAVQPAAAVIEDRYATSPDGVKIHYLGSGSGPLVIMIHGFPDYSGTWTQLTPALSDAYRTVAIDTRGYNFSDQPKGVENYAMPKLVADVAAVIRAEGRDKAIIIGHDFGAIIAWNFAFERPEMLDKLVILSVPHPTTFANELATNPVQLRNSQYAVNFQKEGSEKNLTAEAFAGGIKDPAEKARYIEALKRSDFSAMMNYYRANFPLGKNAPAPGTPPIIHPPVTVPVLVLHGVKDPYLLASGHAGMWNHITKDSTLVMIPDASHNVHHDAPELVNRTIRDWLDARKSSGR
jgi:epoxide hydrolase 4